MVLVFAGIVPIFSGLALGAALVQRRELTEADRSTAFWTGIGLGVIFGVAGVAVSGPVARFYGQPEVRPLFMALSASFVLTALGMTHGQLLVRDGMGRWMGGRGRISSRTAESKKGAGPLLAILLALWIISWVVAPLVTRLIAMKEILCSSASRGFRLIPAKACSSDFGSTSPAG